MKRQRTILATLMMFALLTAATAAPVGADDATTKNDTVSGPLSKGGVLGAIGCGMGIASMIIAPNPISAFAIGFDCGFMVIDALETPDR
jgi:hypothetical protein